MNRPRMWHQVNRIGAKVFVVYGVINLAIGLIAWFVSLSIRLSLEPLLIGNVLLVLVSLVHVLIVSNRVN